MKSQFIGELDARHIEGQWWRLKAPFAYYSAEYNITICAPVGFVLDFSSVPRLPLAYMLAGGTGNRESTIHDLLYRFFYERIMADLIFFESGRVRSRERENQQFLYRAGRLVRTSLMTGMVLGLGWTQHDPLPGCLDYRKKKTCGQNCLECGNYYAAWFFCKMDGYKPELLDIHGAT